MTATMDPAANLRLERSCGPVRRNWFRQQVSRPGFERAEGVLTSYAYTPHRHDTYAVGITLDGVQSFAYRGGSWRSLPGQAFVLHPDEVHDGRAGTEAGLRYRIAYIEPWLVQEALPAYRAPLPFFRDTVVTDGPLRAAIDAVAGDPDEAVEDLKADQLLVQLADALVAADRSAAPLPTETPSLRAARLAREYLDAHYLEPVDSATLADLTGLTRFALTRHFRACFGTSPHRYLVMRRLDHARRLMRSGLPLAAVAAESGFADQSHLSRHFKRAFGFQPGRWASLVA